MTIWPSEEHGTHQHKSTSNDCGTKHFTPASSSTEKKTFTFFTCKSEPNIKQMQNTAANTIIPYSFLTSRLSSWQAHLTRISSYLLPQKAVWWKEREDGFESYDGFQEQHSHAADPPLHHYRSCSLENVYKEKQVVWEEILKKEIELPAPFIEIYNNCGG